MIPVELEAEPRPGTADEVGFPTMRTGILVLDGGFAPVLHVLEPMLLLADVAVFESTRGRFGCTVGYTGSILGVNIQFTTCASRSTK